MSDIFFIIIIKHSKCPMHLHKFGIFNFFKFDTPTENIQRLVTKAKSFY